jgi:hypothetical protein
MKLFKHPMRDREDFERASPLLRVGPGVRRSS